MKCHTKKRDQSLSRIDQALQCGPSIHCEWVRRGNKGIALEPASHEGAVKLANVGANVRQQQCDELAPIIVKPRLNCLEVILKWTSVEENAVSMAHAQRSCRIDVGLALEESYAEIQLSGDRTVLV